MSTNSLLSDIMMVLAILPLGLVMLIGLSIVKVEGSGFPAWAVLLSLATALFFILDVLVPGARFNHLVSIGGALLLVRSPATRRGSDERGASVQPMIAKDHRAPHARADATRGTCDRVSP